MKRIISGVQSSGKLHLGNYLGSISNFVKLQEKYEQFIFVADLHAITVDFDPKALEYNRKDLVATYLASGLDKKTNLFIQSDINEHAALGHVILCHTTLGELERMTQYKSKAQSGLKQDNNTIKIPSGLLTYPTLMAADILLYQADLIPVGADQKQHVELTRDIAIRFNKKYGQLFKVPEPMISEIANRIMDLTDASKKMSKSSKNLKGIIYLDDDEKTITAKIKSAKTDSLDQVVFNYKKQPEVSNLIAIYFGVINDQFNNNLRKEMFNNKNYVEISDIEKKYLKQNYGYFKNDLIRIINNLLSNVQKRKKIYMNQNKMKEILQLGKERAKKIAAQTLENVYKKIGLQKIS